MPTNRYKLATELRDTAKEVGVSLEQIAECLSVSRQTLYSYVKCGVPEGKEKDVQELIAKLKKAIKQGRLPFKLSTVL